MEPCGALQWVFKQLKSQREGIGIIARSVKPWEDIVKVGGADDKQVDADKQAAPEAPLHHRGLHRVSLGNLIFYVSFVIFEVFVGLLVKYYGFWSKKYVFSASPGNAMQNHL